MITEYDSQADALYILVSKKKEKVARSQEIEDGVVVDFDSSGRVIGFEVLDASKRYDKKDMVDFTPRRLVVTR